MGTRLAHTLPPRQMHSNKCNTKAENNIANIQHWPISSQFDMWLDNDVLNWLPTLKNFYRSPFSKCITKIQHCPISSQFDMWVDNDVLNWFPTFPHIKLWWYCTMLNFCDIVVAILKMATSRNCSMSGLISGHHYLPTFQIVMISDNVVDNDVPNWFLTLNNFYWSLFSKWPPQYCKNSTLSDIIKIWYVGRKWCPELIPDIEKFLPIVVAILKMATGRNCSMSGIN
jgi:hypothetical protein